MTVTPSIPADLEQQLRDRAARTGQDLNALILDAVREKLEARSTFREIFAPIHEAFANGQASEDELDELFEEARDQRWRERHPGKPMP
jgi:hypothetical protein